MIIISPVVIATSCHDQYIVYKPLNAIMESYLSFEVDLENPYPSNGSDTVSR